ncbi:LamG-like jellyroll fold domain-containing protein [Xylophilus sp. GW821-FHT01B05]
MHSDNDNNSSLQRRSFVMGAVGLVALGTTACGGGSSSDGGAGTANSALSAEVPATSAAAATTRTFVHPGLLHTEADFERMRTKVNAGAQPWTSGWNALTSNGRSQLGTPPRPLATVVRGGDGQNFAQLYIDVARAYQLALRWKVSQDTRFADQAVVFLNAWSAALTSIQGNADRFLAAGIYGYQFANAAEIMRTYSGWAAADLARFQQMMLDVFYPLNHSFLVNHNGAVITNYWANWDQCALASMLAIGVLCDRQDIYDEAMSYYKTGQGNGAGLQAVYHVHPGNLGQWQESGRDQGHCTLGIGLAGAFCEMAWNQGDDIYGYENNRFLAGSEYVAKSNLLDSAGDFYTMPFFTNINKQGTQSVLSDAGRVSQRVVWESTYNHYANRLGIATPYTALQAAQLRPDRDGSNGDQLGFGTLTFTRDPLSTAPKPSGLTARARGTQVQLSWWGCPDAQSYTVKRATSSGGPYTNVSTGISDLLTFTDSSVSATGVYYYVVVAVGASGESAPSNEEKVSLTPVLLQQWQADGSTRTVASLATGLVKNLADFTIAARVYLDSAATWSRVFDFGSGPRRYLMLTPRSGNGTCRYAISTVHAYNEQRIDGPALPTGRWVHVAVTLSGTVGTLYIDGTAVGSNTQMTLAPFDLGETTQNYLGRSQFSSDPDLQGRVDDFRLYSGALAAADIATLSAG